MSAYDEFILAVERHTQRPGKRNGRNITLLCPAHDDHTPSLDVAEGEGGKPLVQCRSHGCTYQQICDAIGFEGNGAGEWTPYGPAVAVYDYVDENGSLLYQVCRTDAKEFPQRRPDPTTKSGWAWRLGDTKRVLYRLPRVLNAVAAGDTVYVVEGEKDVHAVERAGAVATCNSGGAGKWRAEHGHVIASTPVVIVADRDQAGINHARQVLASIVSAANGTPVRAFVVTASEGKDAADHLAAGHALDDFEPLTDDELGPIELPEPEPDEPAFTLGIVSAKDLCDEPDPEGGNLLGSLVLRGGRTIIVGNTGGGKTTLGLQLVRTILDNDAFLGHTGEGVGGRALIVDLEQGRRSVKRALREARLDGRTDVDLALVPDGLSLDSDPHHLHELDRVIAEGRYVVVLLDPYYKAHRAEEPNAERPIVDLMRTLDKLRTDHGFALILPAHPRKEPPGAGPSRKLTIDDIAGSGAVTRGAEVVLGIERISHGNARLRYLKDREGDLPVGDAIALKFAKDDGFTLDEEATKTRDYPAEILAASSYEWQVREDYRKAIKASEKAVVGALNRLVAEGALEYTVGAPGRHPQAHCYRLPATASLPGMDTNAVDGEPTFNSDSGPTASLHPHPKGMQVSAVEADPTPTPPDAEVAGDLTWQ